MTFYDGNGATKNKECSLTYPDIDQSVSIHHKWKKDKIENKGCKNDEIRSMIICNARKGFAIRVFDDGSLKTKDDHAMVFAKNNMKDCVTIRTFESSEAYTNAFGDEVEVKYLTNGNLDGKISSMEIYFEGIL